MKNKHSDEINIQRSYYKKTANQYEKMHVADETSEHFFALSCLAGLTNYLKIESYFPNIFYWFKNRAIKSLVKDN